MASNKHNTSLKVFNQLKKLIAPKPDTTYFVNRNPRNLELMKIGYKPNGYHLEKAGKCFWHKLLLNQTTHGTTAQIVHFENGLVLQASTTEWAIKKHLYRSNDTSAYINLARVLAQRCLQANILEVASYIDAIPNGKVEKFLQTLESNGLALQESNRYMKKHAFDQLRMEKPWEIVVD